MTTDPDEAPLWSERPAELHEIDYEIEFLIVVQSGHHLGSLRHQGARIKTVEEGFHAHGYRRYPSREVRLRAKCTPP